MQTIDYYNQNAEQFIADTLAVDMGSLRGRFLGHLPSGGRILDAGCGPGRDALAFARQGYRVSAFDASAALAAHAADLLGREVPVRRFEELEEVACYDGIWACASLLHVPEARLPGAFQRLWRALVPGGALYCSFKQGRGERWHRGRRFTDADTARIRAWTRDLPGLVGLETWTTQDPRPGREGEAWVNALLHRAG